MSEVKPIQQPVYSVPACLRCLFNHSGTNVVYVLRLLRDNARRQVQNTKNTPAHAAADAAAPAASARPKAQHCGR